MLNGNRGCSFQKLTLIASWNARVAAQAKHLGGPAGGLPERGARQVAAVAGEVRLIVQIERFADER